MEQDREPLLENADRNMPANDELVKPKRKRGNPALVKGAVPPEMRGRKVGTQNKLTKVKEAIIAKTGITPLEFMLTIVRADPEELKKLRIAKKDVTPTFRMRAADSAAPYIHRRMPIAIEGSNPGDPIAVVVAAFPTDPKLAAEAYQRLVSGRGVVYENGSD